MNNNLPKVDADPDVVDRDEAAYDDGMAEISDTEASQLLGGTGIEEVHAGTVLL
jgi:hypothetical protein